MRWGLNAESINAKRRGRIMLKFWKPPSLSSPNPSEPVGPTLRGPLTLWGPLDINIYLFFGLTLFFGIIIVIFWPLNFWSWDPVTMFSFQIYNKEKKKEKRKKEIKIAAFEIRWLEAKPLEMRWWVEFQHLVLLLFFYLLLGGVGNQRGSTCFEL